MNYASIKPCDVANGVGVRTSLFVSGCRHHCPECFNSEAWDFNYGDPFDEKDLNTLMEAIAPDYIDGLSLLGGEPLEKENIKPVLNIVKQVKANYPNKSIWCYTGFRFEDELLKMTETNPDLKELMSLVDILVEGRFVNELKQLGLRFRGSENQRILYCKESFAAEKALLWEGQ